MLCLALYNVFIIIELSTFISIRGKKRLSNCEGPALTQTGFTDMRRLPGASCLCLEKREEVPQAPGPTCSQTGGYLTEK